MQMVRFRMWGVCVECSCLPCTLGGENYVLLKTLLLVDIQVKIGDGTIERYSQLS